MKPSPARGSATKLKGTQDEKAPRLCRSRPPRPDLLGLRRYNQWRHLPAHLRALNYTVALSYSTRCPDNADKGSWKVTALISDAGDLSASDLDRATKTADWMFKNDPAIYCSAMTTLLSSYPVSK